MCRGREERQGGNTIHKWPPHTYTHPFLRAGPKGWWQRTKEGSGCETTTPPSFLGPLPPQHSSMPQGSQAQPQKHRTQGGPSLQEEGPKGGGMNRDPPGERCQAGGQRAASSGRWRPLQGSLDTTGWMLLSQSLRPSKAASLRAVLRPGGRC